MFVFFIFPFDFEHLWGIRLHIFFGYYATIQDQHQP